MARKKVSDSGGSFRDAMCGRCGKDRTKQDPEQKMYAPCWNCVESGADGYSVKEWLSPTGCQTCVGYIRRRDHVCQKCGMYVSRWGLLYNGDPQQATFDHYPPAWRLAYFAVYGAPTESLLPYVRNHMHDLANVHFVNTVRKELGMETYPEKPGADARTEFVERYQNAKPKYLRKGAVNNLVKDISTALSR